MSSNTSIGIDPARNLVRLAASQPMQESSSLSIGTSDKSWSSDVAVPAGKRLTIEYVSGSFTKKIGSTGEQTAPPFRFTVTTTANGQTVSHVLPVIGVHTISGVIGWLLSCLPQTRAACRPLALMPPFSSGMPIVEGKTTVVKASSARTKM